MHETYKEINKIRTAELLDKPVNPVILFEAKITDNKSPIKETDQCKSNKSAKEALLEQKQYCIDLQEIYKKIFIDGEDIDIVSGGWSPS